MFSSLILHKFHNELIAKLYFAFTFTPNNKVALCGR